MASVFTGAQIVEIRIYDDPSNPNESGYKVVLPMTVLDAVTDPNTGNTLTNLLAQNSGNLGDHTANIDVHVTPEWKANIQQAIGSLIAHTEDTDIHVTAALQLLWNVAAANATLALSTAQNNGGLINGLDGRIAQIEDSLYNGITSNPFSVGFADLSGIIVTYGIWNSTLNRIEC